MTDNNFVGQDIARMQELESSLNRGADELSRVRQDTFSIMNVLRSIWRGRVTEAFAQVWSGQHAPAISQAEELLRSAATVVRQNLDAQIGTSDTLFAGAAAGGAVTAGAGAGAAGVSTGGGDSGVQWVATPPGALPSGRPTEEIFSPDNMTDFVGMHVPVADEARMNELMESLVNDDLSDAQIDDALVEMAVLRGQDPDDFRAQYQDFLGYQEFSATFNPKPQGELDLSRHPDFLGGTASLRYGSVVGDALGIDPVFGALLNPSGGLVGPGSDSFEPGDNDASGYHGIFHDAAGYLYAYQNDGPGYDYLGREPLMPADFPGTGQVGGLSWWVGNNPQLDVDLHAVHMLAGDKSPYLAPIVNHLHRSGFEEVVGQGLLIGETGGRYLEGFHDIATGDFSEGLRDIDAARTDFLVGTFDNVWDSSVKDVENFVAFSEGVVDTAQWAGGHAVDGLETVGGHAVDGLETVGGHAVDGLETVGDGASWALDGLTGLFG